MAHSGETVAGSFVHTLVLTDIATGWTECVALVVREGALVVEALVRLRDAMPFPLRGFDTDNGSEFVNELVLAYCANTGIEFTRSRPYRKNDQAWVEQKNDRRATPRRLQAPRRTRCGRRPCAPLRRFAALRELLPAILQTGGEEARGRAGYEAVLPAGAPVWAAPGVRGCPRGHRRTPARRRNQPRPPQLVDEIRGMQHCLAEFASGGAPHMAHPRDATLDGSWRFLATAWRDGEVRPTHRSEPKQRRSWRTRKDPFEASWPRVLASARVGARPNWEGAVRASSSGASERLCEWTASDPSTPAQGMAPRLRQGDSSS